ncbi:MAG TPA: hypothetical protein VGD67_01950 [Pseudonocardiaceae bacterium]
MDERQLAELFRDAADGGPTAGFGHSDVIAASRRATARRRMAMAGGSALGIMVLVGGIVVGGNVLRDTGGNAEHATSAGGSAQEQSVPQVLEDQQRGSGPDSLNPPPAAAGTDVPGDTAEQGRPSPGQVVPWPGLRDDVARAGCGPVDRELADALVSEFPAATGAESLPPNPFPVPDQCPEGARAAGFAVDGGFLYVVLAPVAGDGPPDMFVPREDGALGFSVYTPKGQVLLVLGVPAKQGDPPPFAESVQQLATAVAERY